RARYRLPVLARPSIRRRASGVVSVAARRHRAVRRESAQEVPGHLPVAVRGAGSAPAVAGARAGRALLGRLRRPHLPRRQPDHPHAKPFRFWEWLIDAVHRRHPDVIFLAEAFTRPKVMRHLAKCGFSQSYTYFTWRNAKAELIDYFTELTQTEAREYLRPNLFTNTPDVLHALLQTGGRPAFAVRFVLAATLGANYGIYGPAFELCEQRALPASEEYLDSEKYQLRHWDLERSDSLRPLIATVNAARHANPAPR